MKACTTASGGVFFIAEKLDRKKTRKSQKAQKAKTSNDNPAKKDKLLK